MGARLLEIDSRSHQPSDSQASSQGNLPSYSDHEFRADLQNLPKDTQADTLPQLQVDGYDYKVAHPAEDVDPQPGLQKKGDTEYDYRTQHPIDHASSQSDSSKLPDVQINNNDDTRNSARRPADKHLPTIILEESNVEPPLPPCDPTLKPQAPKK